MNRFITDMGSKLTAVGKHGERVDLPRFALWEVRGHHTDGVLSAKRKPVVADLSDSLDRLLDVHGDCPVFYID